jgi:hypothetical protein
MYKPLLGVAFFFVVVVFGVVKAEKIMPTPIANSVIAEKPEKAIGGQVAVLLPASLTMKQHQLLNEAYTIAKNDGHKDPAVLQGIILQETRAGGMSSFRVAGNKSDPYYGVGQVKLAAARDVMSSYPKLWTQFGFHTRTDDELKANLILNDKFNLEVVSKYLLILSRMGFSGRDLVNAYNRGPGGVAAVDSADFHYAIGVESKLANMKKGKL